MISGLTTLLGHLHPVIVHLPIGFLLLAVLFEMLSYFKQYQQLRQAVSISLFVGFLSAFAASVFGYLLSLNGDYDLQTLENHKMGGIILTIISGLLFLATTKPFKKRNTQYRRIFTVCCLALFFVVSYTGHLGGSLTHGGDYLSLDNLNQGISKKPTSADEALLFEDIVQPILNKKCAQCHRAGKTKGDLSVESYATLMKGGKSRPAIVAGNLTASELYSRITLRVSDEKHMPADGKIPLTSSEIAIIKWWIEKGNAGRNEKIKTIKDFNEIKPLVSKFLGIVEMVEADATDTKSEIVTNPEIPSEFNASLIDTLRNQGFVVRIMQHNPVMLDITLPPGSHVDLKNLNESLKTVAKSVIWLNLSNNGLKENDLDFLKYMTNLEKLRLEKNPVTDQIVKQLEGLNHLEALNLNETQITRTTLNQLKNKPDLKRIYSWHSLAK